jgi:hypothetical protein
MVSARESQEVRCAPILELSMVLQQPVRKGIERIEGLDNCSAYHDVDNSLSRRDQRDGGGKSTKHMQYSGQ